MTAAAPAAAPAAARQDRAGRWRPGLLDLLTLPAWSIGLLGVALALCLVLWLSLRGDDGSLRGAGWSLGAYAQLGAPLYRRIAWRSLWIAGGSALVTILLAYPAACWIRFRAGRHQALWLTLVSLPFWTSYLLRVFAWKAILGYNGVLNSALLHLHLIAGAVAEIVVSAAPRCC